MEKGKNKKRYKLLYITIGIFLIASVVVLLIRLIIPTFVYLLMQNDYTKTGIENYSPYNSLGLTRYFTLRDETENELFEQYEYEDISYRYHYMYKGELQHELVIVVVNYSSQCFDIIKEEIVSSEYYGDFMCTYEGYDFHFNDAYPKGIHKFEYYNLNTDAPFLRLFNCVGINSDQNSFIFIGFYYSKQNWISGDHYGAYDFLTWDLFFKEFFPEIAS